MKIEPLKITIGELVDGYQDNGEDGVVGFGGKLNSSHSDADGH